MKVLHVIPTMAASYGGPRQTVLEFCQESQGSDVDSEICATGEVQLATYEGVRCHFFPHQWSQSLHYSQPLRRWLAENVARYDLVHINGIFSHATYAAGMACQQQRVPYVVSPHGMLEPWSMAQKRPRKAIAWRFFYRDVLVRAAAIVYSTQQERQLTEESLALTRGVILPAGVSAEILNVRPAKGHKRLLCLSRLHPKKGVDLLLRAFAQLKQQGQMVGWELVIAGDGDDAYVRQLRSIAPAADVHWPGWLNGPAKFATLGSADLFVLSSHQENFGRGVVEAMGCGTPVLLSPQVGLAPEIRAAHAGWVVNLNAAELSQGLLEATRDTDELRIRGDAARSLVEREFIWPRIIEKTIALYEQVLNGKHRELVAV